ncbi:MAG: hypothetical protein AAB611_03545 [Patescibacteria group bacterium]
MFFKTDEEFSGDFENHKKTCSVCKSEEFVHWLHRQLGRFDQEHIPPEVVVMFAMEDPLLDEETREAVQIHAFVCTHCRWCIAVQLKYNEILRDIDLGDLPPLDEFLLQMLSEEYGIHLEENKRENSDQ